MNYFKWVSVVFLAGWVFGRCPAWVFLVPLAANFVHHLYRLGKARPSDAALAAARQAVAHFGAAKRGEVPSGYVAHSFTGPSGGHPYPVKPGVSIDPGDPVYLDDAGQALAGPRPRTWGRPDPG